MPQDYDLWRKWIGGDEAAGARLVERHFLAVYRFFGSKLADQADDLTQATFEACIAGRDTYRGEGAFRAYILGIARRQLLRHLEGRGQLVGGRATSEVSMEDLEPSPSTVAAVAQQRDLLLAAMRRIPIDYQIVLELHYWEDMTTEEIAGVLEVAPGTVKSRLSRARAELRHKFERSGSDQALQTLAQELRGALERR